jgi:hypothetical protein
MFAIIRCRIFVPQYAIQKYKPEDKQNYNFVLYGCETWLLNLREESRLRLFKNRVLKRIFGPTRYEVTGDKRKLHSEELNDMYCSPNIIRVIKSRRTRKAGHVERMGKRKAVNGVWWGDLSERDHLQYTGIDKGVIKLRWVFGKCDGNMDWINLAHNRNR